MTKRGRPPANPEMGVLIQSLVDHRLPVEKIIAAVQKEYGEDGAGASDRNIQRLVAKARVADDTPPWTPISQESAEDAALLLPVVQVVAEVTEGRLRVTQAQAKLLLWVRRIVPDLAPWPAFRLVLAYQRRSGQDTDDLDAFLSWAPWRSPEAMDRFLRWVIDCRPGWLIKRPARSGTLHRYGQPWPEGTAFARDRIALAVTPVRPGQPIPADALGLTNGVAIALEIRKDLEKEEKHEPTS